MKDTSQWFSAYKVIDILAESDKKVLEILTEEMIFHVGFLMGFVFFNLLT